jgi:hypothetical protein
MGIREEAQRRKIQKRQGLGGRDILTVSGVQDTDEYVYRFVNDVGDRIQRLWSEGYEFVDKAGKAVGDTTVESARGTDSLLKKGVGRGVTAYLMKIPRDLYNEYQAEKEHLNAAVDEQLKRSGREAGSYGSIESFRK